MALAAATRVRTVLRRARRRRGRSSRCSSNRRPDLSSALPGPRDRVRREAARALLRLLRHGRDADRRRAPADQDAVRAGRAAQERADLERGAQRRHARGRAGQVRVRGRSRDRRGLPAQRRDELGLSRRSSAAARTRPSCTTRNRAGRWSPAICCSSTPRPTIRATPATSRAPIRSTARSRATQRDIYEIVLAAQEAGDEGGRRPARRRSEIQAACDDVLRAGLVKLGLVTDADGTAVQDLVDARRVALDRHGRARRRPCRARSRRAWRSSSSPASTSARRRSRTCRRRRRTPRSSRRSRPMVEKYKNIGVRIEDSFLLTATGLERLSARCRGRSRRSSASSSPLRPARADSPRATVDSARPIPRDDVIRRRACRT